MLTTSIITKIFFTSAVCFFLGYAMLIAAPKSNDVPHIVQLIIVMLCCGGVIGIFSSLIAYIWVS